MYMGFAPEGLPSDDDRAFDYEEIHSRRGAGELDAAADKCPRLAITVIDRVR